MSHPLAEALTNGAGGYLPHMAAAALLVSTGNVGRAIACGLVEVVTEDDGGRYAFLVSPSEDDGRPLGWWQATAGVYSSGERAVLALAASMAHGELSDAWWSIDTSTRRAVISALGVQ